MKRIFENASVVSIVDGNITLKCDNKLIHHSNVSLVSVFDNTVVLECPDFKKGDLIAVNLTPDNYTGLYIYEELTDYQNIFMVHGGINNYVTDVRTDYFNLELLPQDTIRLASKEEHELFDEYCKKQGKIFNFKTNTWEEHKWKPKNGDKFYMVTSFGKTDLYIYDENNQFKKSVVEIGNCFRTKEEAEKKAKEYLKLMSK